MKAREPATDSGAQHTERFQKEMLKDAVLLAEQLTRRFWFLLCGGPVVCVALYQLSKSVLGWHFAGRLGRPDVVQPDAALILATVFVATLVMIRWHARLTRWVPLLAALIATFASIGVWRQMDRDLLWEGLEVPTTNYNAAVLALRIGPRELIETWNARANPRVEPNYLPHPHEVIDRLERLGLGWIAGTRWDRLDLPQDNNRMHMHPPGYPLVMAAWLSLFGTSRAAASAFELVVKCLLIMGAAAWAMRSIPAEESVARLTVGLLLATIPATALNFFPHGNELASLLAVGGFVLGCQSPSAARAAPATHWLRMRLRARC
jgi:hypothetical protein